MFQIPDHMKQRITSFACLSPGRRLRTRGKYIPVRSTAASLRLTVRKRRPGESLMSVNCSGIWNTYLRVSRVYRDTFSPMCRVIDLVPRGIWQSITRCLDRREACLSSIRKNNGFWQYYQNPFAVVDDCRDAGGRTMQEQLSRRRESTLRTSCRRFIKCTSASLRQPAKRGLSSAPPPQTKKGCLAATLVCLVEAAGIEPASANPLPSDLHAYPRLLI